MYSVFTKQIYHLKIHSRPKKYWNGISSLTFFLKHLSGTLKFDWLITPGSFSLYKPLVTDRSHLLAWTFRYWFTLNYVSYVYVKKKKRNPMQKSLVLSARRHSNGCFTLCILQVQKSFVHRVFKTLTCILKYEWVEMLFLCKTCTEKFNASRPFSRTVNLPAVEH